MFEPVHLTQWIPWDQRSSLSRGPGLYLIGKGAGLDVIYIGMTVGRKGIRYRLSQFHRSATTGQPGHAGGVTYHNKLGSDVTELWVRSHIPHGVATDDQVMGCYVEYAERALIWQHVRATGQRPICNTQ
ncbi:hypothetical protein [Parvularcula marina]|uniref:GIY-YIG domain-containing protein n=1 Tax=Parvularcula marina TaxID=2292771 RepID=A0A371R7H4_9PROT|nr:hypothetical protein [Parvularcula marina]RFB01412.1 hypothetical protein DX908_14060 [Parvularcula marina]